MSGCEKYQELISRMLDDDLTPLEDALLAEHLKTCASCRAVYAAFSALSGALSEELEEPPQALRANVMAGIRREELRKKNRHHRGVTATLAAAAAIAVVIGASFALTPLFRGGKAGGAAVYQNAASAGADTAAAAFPAWDAGAGQEAVLTGGLDGVAAPEEAAEEKEMETEAAAAPAPVPASAPQPDTASRAAAQPAAGGAEKDAYADSAEGTVIVEGGPRDSGEEGDSLIYIELSEGRRQDQLLGLLKGRIMMVYAAADQEDEEDLPLEDLPETPDYVLDLDGSEPQQIYIYLVEDKVYYAQEGEDVAHPAHCTVRQLQEMFG